MSKKKRFGALSSSTNPQELSLTVTSAVQLVVGALVAFGLLTVTGGNTVIEQVTVLVPAGYAAYQACMTIYGALRKVLVAFTEQK